MEKLAMAPTYRNPKAGAAATAARRKKKRFVTASWKKSRSMTARNGQSSRLDQVLNAMPDPRIAENAMAVDDGSEFSSPARSLPMHVCHLCAKCLANRLILTVDVISSIGAF